MSRLVEGPLQNQFIALPLSASAYLETSRARSLTHIVDTHRDYAPLCHIRPESILRDMAQVRDPEWASCARCRSRWARILAGEVQ